MKTRHIIYATLSFLAVNICICPYVVAASTLQLTQTSQEISGSDSESGVAFRASLLEGDHVIADLYIGSKRIHADIDYTRQTTILRTVSQGTETPVALSVQDILAFQKLRVSLLTSKIHTSGRHGDALGTVISLMTKAPAGIPIDFNSGLSPQSYTSICPHIGGPGIATYTLGIIHRKTYHKAVTVGPVCYRPPALGRCGAGAGPDPGIGFQQKFTQECLNHDVCCDATKKPAPVCGTDCLPSFYAAIQGYLHAPDCGNTGGNWADSNGLTYALSDADSNGNPKVFSPRL